MSWLGLHVTVRKINWCKNDNLFYLQQRLVVVSLELGPLYTVCYIVVD